MKRAPTHNLKTCHRSSIWDAIALGVVGDGNRRIAPKAVSYGGGQARRFLAYKMRKELYRA